MGHEHKVRWDRAQWFRDARYGVFIHYGLYSTAGRGEWVQSVERIPHPEYRARYFDQFTAKHCDMNHWARTVKQYGMKYGVLTAKHHDGFCLFDSKYTDYTSVHTPAKRDLIKEYVDAFRSEGLKVGIYYSLVDWAHPDYPAWKDRQHPLRDDESQKNQDLDFDRYLSYMHNQVKELCTNYGKIDILWFDFSYWDMKGERWKATELVDMVRSLQPDILIDNRLGGDLLSKNPPSFAGDFAGPEQMVPRKQVTAEDGTPLPWEICVTLNNSWGFHNNDSSYKKPEHITRLLSECVSKGGNVMINLGPDGFGRIPTIWKDILSEVSHWLDLNGEAIYGCGPSQLPEPSWGWFTQKEDQVYAHVHNPTIGHFNLPGCKGKYKMGITLYDGTEVHLGPYWNAEAGAEIFDDPADLFMNFSLPLQNTNPLPDYHGTVVKLIQ